MCGWWSDGNGLGFRGNIEIAIASRNVQNCFCEIGTCSRAKWIELFNDYNTLIFLENYEIVPLTVWGPSLLLGIRGTWFGCRRIRGPRIRFHPDTFGRDPFIYFFVFLLLLPRKIMLTSAQQKKIYLQNFVYILCQILENLLLWWLDRILLVSAFSENFIDRKIVLIFIFHVHL